MVILFCFYNFKFSFSNSEIFFSNSVGVACE